jgi:hypothetical protein
MKCPVCEELHREHSLACKEEATVSLQQRYEMLSPAHQHTDPEALQKSREVILSSKKRQLKISSRMEHHRALAHSA